MCRPGLAQLPPPTLYDCTNKRQIEPGPFPPWRRNRREFSSWWWRIIHSSLWGEEGVFIIHDKDLAYFINVQPLLLLEKRGLRKHSSMFMPRSKDIVNSYIRLLIYCTRRWKTWLKKMISTGWLKIWRVCMEKIQFVTPIYFDSSEGSPTLFFFSWRG